MLETALVKTLIVCITLELQPCLKQKEKYIIKSSSRLEMRKSPFLNSWPKTYIQPIKSAGGGSMCGIPIEIEHIVMIGLNN